MNYHHESFKETFFLIFQVDFLCLFQCKCLNEKNMWIETGMVCLCLYLPKRTEEKDGHIQLLQQVYGPVFAH